MKILILFGSSRDDGDTMKAVNHIVGSNDAELVNLREKSISAFDYDHKNIDDDFIEIAKSMNESDIIIFATPVYWYSMSGILKIFFDRFTDLITVKKDIGRALKGKKCYVISCGSDKSMPKGFEEPFSATCDYLGMQYKGGFYYYMGKNEELAEETKNNADIFSKQIFN